ncbi:DivIVA domain-containing protein [Arcanobacterium haemolyticum]|nr:DivIVA domain-containing protein [Arcanobacterium haemolyticum]
MANDTFERVGFFSVGYEPGEVDEFLARAKAAYSEGDSAKFDELDVRNAAFSSKRHGYSPEAVDAALDRLEAAFIQARRAQVVQTSGENAWLNDTYAQAKSLYPRLLRPAGERFRDAEGWGYLKDEVDAVIDQLADYFDGKASLSSAQLRDVSFKAAKNENAYDEAVVDTYLERAMTVLVSVE